MQLSLRKAAATDLEPSAFVGTDPEERQDRRLDQRRALAGVASQARRRPIMKRSRAADLMRGISHNQWVGVGITCSWLTLAKFGEVHILLGCTVVGLSRRDASLGSGFWGCLGRPTAFGSVRELMPYGSCVSEINGSTTFSWSAAPRDLLSGSTTLCLLEYSTTVQVLPAVEAAEPYRIGYLPAWAYNHA